MATTTTKLGLTKPAYTDVVDVADLNDNADKLDAAAGFTIVADAAARPASPWTGQVIYQVDVTSSFMWDGSAWQPAGGGGGSIEISATAPASPSAGDLWWDSDNGNLYIYYDDGDSQQWVAANGPQVFVGTSAPAGYQGQLWFDSTDGKTYIYYDDGTSSQWVSAIGGSLSGNVIQVVSATTTTAVTTTSTSYVTTGLSATITPRSASSKILVLASGILGNTGASNSANATLFRGTVAGTDLASGSRMSAAYGGAFDRNAMSITFLDSPATTSAQTYTVGFRTDNASYISYFNSETSLSSIVLMEIAG